MTDLSLKPVSPALEVLYKNPLPAHRTGPLFNAVSYPTKISPESIGIFIASHTAVGASVLDVFSGSGSTGLGALLCDKPTPWMIETASALGLEPAWGPRSAVLYDVGVFPSLIADVLCDPPPEDELGAALERVIARTEAEELYAAVAPDGSHGHVRYIIWTEFVACNECGREQSFLASHVEWDPLRIHGVGSCVECGRSLDGAARLAEAVHDPYLGHEVIARKRRPALVYGATGKRTWRREARASDGPKRLVRPAASVRKLELGDLYRSGYHTGITHLHHLYTERNFSVMSAIWSSIEQEPAGIQSALKLLCLSFNATHSTLMTRVVAKQGQSDFVITGAQSGVLYISALPVEKNIVLGLRRKARVLEQAFAMVRGSRSKVDVRCASSERIDAPDQSFDYVFTDPPFGDFIPYAEVNQVNELWLGRTTPAAQEITVSRHHGRDVGAYGRMLETVFAEVGRVLKPSGLATLVFHAAKSAVWNAVAGAVDYGCLRVEAASVLDKRQPSFKQVVAAAGVRGDGLFLLRPAADRVDGRAPVNHRDLALSLRAEGLRSADPDEATPQRLYSRYIGRCMTDGMSVELDAAQFYEVVGVT